MSRKGIGRHSLESIDLIALFRYDASHLSMHFPFIFNDFRGRVGP
jgi:hypothetical protein